MKYVMFTHTKTGIRCPAFVPDLVTHCDVKIGDDWVATSAAHFDFKTLQTHGDSSSLGLNPKPDDAEICTDVFAGVFAATCMVMQDTDANLKALEQVVIAKAQAKSGPGKILPWCVWWFVAGQRSYQDFETFQGAEAFIVAAKQEVFLANIKDLPWHPNHPR
jgi:hypothetical protein